jgi:GNAT superfamily N-acetyltransferase
VEAGVSFRPPEPIGPEHDTRDFDCGIEPLNRWLRECVAPRGVRSATFVAAGAGSRVRGFYSLSAGSLRNTRAGGPGPILKLGRLAVDRAAQGRGLGTALVMDAFARAYAVSRHTPARALLADAPDAGVAGWLRELGFLSVPGDATALFVALGTIEALVADARG